MPCNFPIKAYYAREINSTGKRSLVFNSNQANTGIPIEIPCQQCTACKLERSRQWAMRCMHEAQTHEENMFVTLTYDEQNVPTDQSLHKEHLQLFHKRLHNRLLRERNRGIRYYACGEYGDQNQRPHYHSLIFGYRFKDLQFYKYSKSGAPIYTSKMLQELWPDGMAPIGDVTFESAAYVARYVTKKITGEQAADHYQGRLPEFCVMSRRPGIGLGWLQKHQEQTYDHDTVTFRGREMRPPKYYDNKLEQLDRPTYTIIKTNRRRKRRYSADNSPDRRKVKDKVLRAKLNLYKRTVE